MIINEVIIAVYVYDNSKVHLPLYSRPLCFPFHNYLWFIIDEWRKGERATSLAISCANIFVSEAEVLKEMRRDHEIEAKETLNANEGRGMKCKLWNEKKDFISDKRNKLLQLHSGGSDKTLSGENKLQKVYKKSTAFSTPPQHSRSNEWKLISQSGTAWN